MLSLTIHTQWQTFLTTLLLESNPRYDISFKRNSLTSLSHCTLSYLNNHLSTAGASDLALLTCYSLPMLILLLHYRCY